MNKCAICGRANDLFTLEFTAEENDNDDPYTSHVCGRCWDHIAAIARRALRYELDELKRMITSATTLASGESVE